MIKRAPLQLRNSSRLIFGVLSSLVLILTGCSAHKTATVTSTKMLAPADATRLVRESLPNDYLRVIYVPVGAKVKSLSKPGSLRAFATASQLFSPPLVL